MKKDNKVFVIVLLLLIVGLVMFFPQIYNYVENAKLPKIGNVHSKNNDKIKKVEKGVLDSLHYPVMRNSIYNSNTYYTLDKFNIGNMSNTDILYNAFLDIYEGNITGYSGYVSCTTDSKQFNKDYIELRIKNILGKGIKYTLENFNVPSDSKSSYKGSWVYDANNGVFIYNGKCNEDISATTYYNLEEYIKSKYDDSDVIVYKYVGFAKVEGNNYNIYSDAAMTNSIKSGTINNVEELDSIFKDISKKDKKIYKYTFKDTLCSYNEYCLYEGEWTNEL